jgi:hypothetical protein
LHCVDAAGRTGDVLDDLITRFIDDIGIAALAAR